MYRFLRAISFIIISTIIFSCDDSEDIIPDKTGPEIFLLSPSNDSRVKGTIIIAASADDLSNDISMEISLDGILLKQDASKLIETELDTKSISEGAHTIKVNATDGEGNVSTKEFPFEVRNTLMIIDVSASYVPENAKIFYLLSQNNGDLIAHGAMKNGTIISVATPENFNPDSSFVYSEYFFLDDGFNLIKSVNAYASMEAGLYSVVDYGQARPVAGQHHIELTEIPSSHLARMQGRNISSFYYYSPPEGVYNGDISMYGEESDVFIDVVQNERPPLYRYMESIATGGTTRLSVNDFVEMEMHTVFLKEKVSNFSVSVNAFQNDYQTVINVYNGEGVTDVTELPVYVPGDVFSNLRTAITLRTASGIFDNVHVGPSVPLTFQYIDAEAKAITRSGNHIYVNTSGDFDICTVNAADVRYENGGLRLKGCSYNFASSGIQEMALPHTLPTELVDLGFDELGSLQVTQASFYDYSHLNGADDYRQKIVFSSDRQVRSAREGKGKVQPWTQNNLGRVSVSSTEKLSNIQGLNERLNLTLKY